MESKFLITVNFLAAILFLITATYDLFNNKLFVGLAYILLSIIFGTQGFRQIKK